MSGLQGVRIEQPRQVISFRVSNIYSQKLILLPEAFVLPNLTAIKVGQKIKKENWKHLKRFQLADPNFEKTSKKILKKIDVLIEMDIYSALMRDRFRQPV